MPCVRHHSRSNHAAGIAKTDTARTSPRPTSDVSTATIATASPSTAHSSTSATIDHDPTKSPTECVIQYHNSKNMNVPESQPQKNASFQDAFDQSKNSGTRAMNANNPKLADGNARLKSHGPASDATS